LQQFKHWNNLPPTSLIEELKRYCYDVLADRPLTCQKHKWACQRFICDIDKQDTDLFPYIFDPERANRFFAWMRLFKHHQGVLTGKQIEPHIIQKFIFGNIYGWIHRATKYRRFNKFYWQVARKNGKSQSLACVGTYELMALNPNETSEVYCAAIKTEQARIVWHDAEIMLNQSDYFKDKNKYTIAYNRIKHNKSGSIMRALSKEDRRSGDGLHPQCGIIDEYHAHETSEIYDVIDSGMGSRTQPLLGIITTAGFDLANPCYRVEYDLVSKILNPDIPVEIDSYFAMINELDKDEKGELIDDIKDEKVWIKANPIICSYPEGVDYLRKKLKEAIEAPEKMRNFLTKHVNVWVQQRESGYMDMAKWGVCAGEMPVFTGETCWIGLDLSAKIDLTSVSFEFRVGDSYYVMGHSFMPEETLDKKEKTDKVPYRMWVKDGWITVTPGAVIDYRVVKAYVIDEAARRGWRVSEWCIDPWGATQLSSDLIDDGYTPVEIVQGIKTLSEPTKNFREMVYSGRVVHDKNPVLTWAISNAVAETVDRNENIILSKKKSRQRIDPIAAVINSHVRAMVNEQKKSGRVFFA
jgi:phage terminase large subunit-like protein